MPSNRKSIILVATTVMLLVGGICFAVVNNGIIQTHAAGKIGTQQVQPAASSGDWSMFQNGLDRSGYNANETTINATTASKLKVHWTNKAAGSISSQIISANGLLYWGSWDGLEHATNLSGTDVWTANLGQTTSSKCAPPTVGVSSSADVVSMSLNGASSVVFVGGGNGVFYALNAANGNVLWSTPLGTPPNFFLWSSPAVYNGSVYEGLSSFGDCPLSRGEMIQMNATTGAIQHIFYTMPQGCKGAGVWDSPTIDTSNNTLYFGTSNTSYPTDTCKVAGQYYWNVVEVNTADLSLVHAWQLPTGDQHANSDFGQAAPMLFTATINGTVHNMIGMPNQNGKYYAFDRANISNGPVWEVQLATPGRGSISSSAWDGTAIYAAGTDTTINGATCQGSVRAINPANGSYIWEKCWTAGRALNAVVAVPGVVVVGQGRYLNVLSASSGQQLYRYIDTGKNSNFDGSPTISNGILYIGNQDGNLYAFGL